MPGPFNLVLTAEQQEQIRQFEADKIHLENVISDAQKRLVTIDDFLNAVALVTGAGSAPPAGPSDSTPRDEPASPINMTEAIEKIASESAAPVSRKALRDLLAAQGFPPDRLGNYFYTVIHRLKNKGRIVVTADGSVIRRVPDETITIRRRI